jgi:hypothetical protein
MSNSAYDLVSGRCAGEDDLGEYADTVLTSKRLGENTQSRRARELKERSQNKREGIVDKSLWKPSEVKNGVGEAR